MAIDSQEYIDFINSKEYIALYDYYNRETFMDVLGVGRQENPHSSFLRWLFDPNGSHGLGDYPLNRLIDTLCLQRAKIATNQGHFVRKKNLFHNKNKDKISKIIFLEYNINDVTVEREAVLNGQRRADILIKFSIPSNSEGKAENENGNEKYVILIENKIHSAENNEQTVNYTEDLFDEKLFSDCNYILPVYLLPYFDQPEESQRPGSEEFLYINYQALLDGVIEPCLVKKKSPYGDLMIDEYIRCLSKANSNSDDIVMAISRRERDCVKTLWNTHCNVLGKIFKLLAENNYSQKQFDTNFYCAIAFALYYCVNYENFDVGEYKSNIEAVKNGLSDAVRKSFTIEYKNVKYSSGNRGKTALAFLARELIIEYVNSYPNLTIDEIRTKLRKDASINSPWHKEILIEESKADALQTCPCSDIWGDCRLCEKVSRRSISKGDIDKAVENCPLNDQKMKPDEFLKQATDNERMNSLSTCCKESFNHVFYNSETTDSGRKKTDGNEKEYLCLRAHSANKENYYVARFFGVKKIIKIAKMLGYDCDESKNQITIVQKQP